MNHRSNFNKKIKFALNRRSIAAVCLLESALVGKLVQFALDLITDLKSCRVSRQYSRHLDTPQTWNIVAEVFFKTMPFYIHINIYFFFVSYLFTSHDVKNYAFLIVGKKISIWREHVSRKIKRRMTWCA